jgi:hypothetical protein
VLVVLGALALVVVLAGPRLVGALPDAALRELKDDPLATYEPPRGELVDTREQKADRENFLGKPVFAQFTRVFELPAGANPRREVDRALAAALAAGWQLNEGSRGVSESGGSLAVGLDKLLPTGETMSANLTLYTHESSYLPSNVTPPALRISLKSPELD